MVCKIQNVYVTFNFVSWCVYTYIFKIIIIINNKCVYKYYTSIFIVADSVARMSYSQTMHPKESLISQGLSSKSIFLKNHNEYM